MWGDGLRENRTFRYQVADWLASQTNRPVDLTTFAHSSALLSNPSAQDPTTPNPAPSIGDLNSSLPSVEQQVECASTMNGLSRADLILVEGCINDVGAESIVYPWTETEKLKKATEEQCSGPMAAELQKIGQHFPSAVVVVVGYYPLVSEKSSIFGFSGTRRLRKRATKIYSAKHPTAQREPKRMLSRDEEHGIMVMNSEEFYQDSKNALEGAVGAVNETGTRFFFARLPEISNWNAAPTVDPVFAYGAPQRHEWMIPVRFLFFWAFHKDQKYWYRQRLCDEYVRDPIERMVCQSNPAFHPNIAGAQAYTDSIEAVIPGAEVAGWRAAGEL